MQERNMKILAIGIAVYMSMEYRKPHTKNTKGQYSSSITRVSWLIRDLLHDF